MKAFADDNFEIDENGRKFTKLVGNMEGKGEIVHYEQFLLFTVFLTLSQTTNFRLFQTQSVCRRQFQI